MFWKSSNNDDFQPPLPPPTFYHPKFGTLESQCRKGSFRGEEKNGQDFHSSHFLLAENERIVTKETRGGMGYMLPAMGGGEGVRIQSGAVRRWALDQSIMHLTSRKLTFWPCTNMCKTKHSLICCYIHQYNTTSHASKNTTVFLPTRDEINMLEWVHQYWDRQKKCLRWHYQKL